MPELGETEMRLSPLGTAAGDPGVLQRVRRTRARHPEWWMLLLSAAAWAFLVVSARSHTGHGDTRGLGGYTAGPAAMVIAMMLPLTAGHVRGTAHSAASPPGLRAAAAFLAGYLAVWMLAMGAIDVAWRLTLSVTGWTAAAGVVIAATVLWEVAPARWRQPHAAHGRWMDAGGARLGAAAGGSCVASCWALMAACVAFAHSLPVMAAFFVVQLHGRYRRPASPALTALAVLGVCLVSLALTMAGHHHHSSI